jgi:hypothetical protein
MTQIWLTDQGPMGDKITFAYCKDQHSAANVKPNQLNIYMSNLDTDLNTEQ